MHMPVIPIQASRRIHEAIAALAGPVWHHPGMCGIWSTQPVKTFQDRRRRAAGAVR